MKGSLGLGFFFGAPLALIIVVNTGLFVATAVQLRRTAKMTKGVNDKTDQTLFVACVRLSSVMGFTWIFGFLANIPVLEFCWYLFILLNTLTGVFICGAFVANSRVLKMYRKLFKDDDNEISRTQSSTLSENGTKKLYKV